MKALAAKKPLTLPATPGEDQQKVYNKVVAGKGAKLAQQYVQAMLDDHQEDKTSKSIRPPPRPPTPS